jgi:hypothetical protein
MDNYELFTKYVVPVREGQPIFIQEVKEVGLGMFVIPEMYKMMKEKREKREEVHKVQEVREVKGVGSGMFVVPEMYKMIKEKREKKEKKRGKKEKCTEKRLKSLEKKVARLIKEVKQLKKPSYREEDLPVGCVRASAAYTRPSRPVFGSNFRPLYHEPQVFSHHPNSMFVSPHQKPHIIALNPPSPKIKQQKK